MFVADKSVTIIALILIDKGCYLCNFIATSCNLSAQLFNLRHIALTFYRFNRCRSCTKKRWKKGLLGSQLCDFRAVEDVASLP